MTAAVVLLDLDGTLTDSAPGILRSVEHALVSLGEPVPAPEVLRSFLGPPLHASFARLGVDAERAVAAYRERFVPIGIHELQVYDGVEPLLSGLRSDGALLALATAKPEPFALQIVASAGWVLDAVVGSQLDGSRSTKAEIISEALRLLDRTPSESVMVGDRAEDCLGAAECGVAFVGAGWGYGEPGELKAAGATRIAPSPLALLDLLRTS